MEMLHDNSACPVDEIAEYIDGELDAAREMEMEMHLAGCAACADELNLQKQFLCDLESGLKQGSEIEVPADFAKHIVANAESTVSGLRRPRERFNAVFICAALFLFILFALGADAANMLGSVAGGLDQAAAVGGFFGHFIYSFFLGLMIVVRTFATQVRPEVFGGALLAIGAVLLLAFISQRLLAVRRA